MTIPDNTSFELAQIHKIWLNEWRVWIQNANTGRKEDDFQIQQQMHSGSGLKQTGAIQSQLLLTQARPTLMKSSSLGDKCVCVFVVNLGLGLWSVITTVYKCHATCNFSFLSFYQARALRALGLLLADGTPTVGGGKTFWAVSQNFLRKQL